MSKSTESELWGNSSSNFAKTWNLEVPGSFIITEGAQTPDMNVQASSVRGLTDATYEGTFDGSEEIITIEFVLAADGYDVGTNKKKLTYQRPMAGASLEPALLVGSGLGPAWGSDVDDFEGTWEITSTSKIVIQNGGQVQFVSVTGIQDGAYQGTFDSASKTISIVFTLGDNGHVDDDTSKPRELIFNFPEVSLLSMIEVPSEGELFEEDDGGS